MRCDVDALRDDQWDRLKDLVPGGRAGERGPRCDNRRFVDALLWMARSGGRWRDLPERFGDYQAVKRRYYRWIERGALDRFPAEHDKTLLRIGCSYYQQATLLPPEKSALRSAFVRLVLAQT